MTPDIKDGVVAGAKLSSVWGAFKVGSWYDVSYMLASILSFLFIADFVWKKWLRPFCEWRGWVKRSRRKDAGDSGPAPLR